MNAPSGRLPSPLASGQPLVRELLPRVVDLCPRKSLATYRIGFLRLVDALGDRPLTEVTPMDLESLRDQVQSQVGLAKVATARSRGRPLRSYDKDAHGKGAAENFVRSVRFFFRVAEDSGLVQVSPARAVKPPRRPPAPERPLTEAELSELLQVAIGSGDDPELDRLLVLFLRHTGCRREGCLNLTVDALDLRRQAVTVSEKNGSARTLPLARWLIEELATFARQRGARRGSDAVFRYSSGQPITRKRFNTLFDRLDDLTDWSEPLDVGPHWLRHTTLADVAAVAGLRVAEAYAGHATTDAPTIFRYTQVDFDDLVHAYHGVFGVDD